MHISRYFLASAKDSFGALSSLSICGLRISITAVKTSAAIPYMVNIVPIVFLTSSCLCAPMNCAISTVPPTESPLIRLITRIVTLPPIPTAEVPTGPLNWPTISMSAILYIACNKFDNKKGSANLKSCFATLPRVRSCWNLLKTYLSCRIYSQINV